MDRLLLRLLARRDLTLGGFFTHASLPSLFTASEATSAAAPTLWILYTIFHYSSHRVNQSLGVKFFPGISASNFVEYTDPDVPWGVGTLGQL